MTHDTDRLVKKLWSYCDVLRDDGLSYQDYLEQLTFLLFLKMADERVAMMGGEHPVPERYRWRDLSKPDMEGARLDEHYRNTLRHLGQQKGMLGLIFVKGCAGGCHCSPFVPRALAAGWLHLCPAGSEARTTTPLSQVTGTRSQSRRRTSQ